MEKLKEMFDKMITVRLDLEADENYGIVFGIISS